MNNYDADSEISVDSEEEQSDASVENSDISQSDVSQMSIDDEMEQEEYEEEDPDNPPPYKEPEDFTVEYVLNWIRDDQPMDEDGTGEYVDYPEIDYEEIVQRTSNKDICEVINALMEDDIDNKDITYFNAIKNLIVEANIELHELDLVDKYLIQAVREADKDVINFFIKQGARLEDATEEAISIDSVEMLEFLEAEVEEDNIVLAMEKRSYEALGYFLNRDFSSCYEIVLSTAIEESIPELIEVVCDNTELEQVYDLIKYLVDNNGEKLIPVFFRYFPLEKLLTEIQEQDGNRGYCAIVLDYAKDYVSESKMSQIEAETLLTAFDEKLQISSRTLIFPKGDFKGCAKLKELREVFNKNTRLSEENKLAVNFIGVNFSTANRYFTAHPNHPSEKSKSETYFRSAKHPLSIFVKPSTAQFQPHPSLPEAKASKGMGHEANLGLYKSPLDSLNKFKEVIPSQKTQVKKVTYGDSKLYDLALHYRHRICKYIAEKFSSDNTASIKVGFYHNYPCLMVHVKKPARAANPAEAALTAWIEIVISYFVGLVNYTAQYKNLNIELVRRSSFSFLTPTIAPCSQSFRISVGIIPTDYADILIECLKIINEVLKVLDKQTNILTAMDLNLSLPNSCFIKTAHYKNYMDKKKIPKAKNILELVWAKVDRGGKTGAYNLMRTSAARDGLTCKVYGEIHHSSPKTTVEYTSILINVLQWGFSKLNIVAKKLQFNQNEEIVFNKILKSHASIKDAEFFKFILMLVDTARSHSDMRVGLLKSRIDETITAIETYAKEKIIGDLYFHLEMLNELLYSKAIYTCSERDENEFGSDSEVEDKSPESSCHIYGKKMIVHNGMRAILTALHAGAHYLLPDYLTTDKKLSLFLHGAYYETADAMRLLTKFHVIREFKKINNAKIMIYDVNACITNGIELLSLKESEFTSIKVLIIDSTSASIEEHNDWIKEFQQRSEMAILFFVSSGFKNEQMGADKNPYGTIRIFTKNKQIQNEIIAFIKSVEGPIQSNVSLHYRRLMKEMGNTPCNHTFFPQQNKMPSSSLDGPIKHNNAISP